MARKIKGVWIYLNPVGNWPLEETGLFQET